MKTSSKGISLIKRHEGLRLRAYLCPAKVWTIGYGHTRSVKSGDVITQAQADELLRADISEVEQVVIKERLNINQNQFDALVCFVFNVGSVQFKGSTLLRMIKANPADLRINAEFGKWIYSKGKVLPGLVLRRKDESELYFAKTM